MSSGHHHKTLHHPDLIAEVERLSKDSAVIRYLRQPHTVDLTQRVPLTGGSSKNGRIYYLDKDMPKKFHATVLWHERFEKALRAVKGMSYDRAHNLATAAERMKVEESGKDWTAYKKEIAGIVRANEKETPHKMPAGFDTGPYRESNSMALIA
jgi:hypothetical protein